jgi:hypothetical protein
MQNLPKFLPCDRLVATRILGMHLLPLNFPFYMVYKYRMRYATETARFRRSPGREERERKKSSTATPGLPSPSPTSTQFVSSIHSKSPINRSTPLSVNKIRTLSILKLLPSKTLDIWILHLVVHNSLPFVCCA